MLSCLFFLPMKESRFDVLFSAPRRKEAAVVRPRLTISSSVSASLPSSPDSRIRMTHAATGRPEISLRLADTCSNYLHSARCHLSLLFLHSTTGKKHISWPRVCPFNEDGRGRDRERKEKKERKKSYPPQLNFQA